MAHPLFDSEIDDLLHLAQQFHGTGVNMTLSGETVVSLTEEVRDLRAASAVLQSKLDAVPEYATYYRERNVWEDELPMTLDEWLAKQEVQL